jgi:hypothetical protein
MSTETRSLAELRSWLETAPPGTLVPAAELARALAGPTADVRSPTVATEVSWRERLWTVPPETRLGIVELGQALGRPKSWVYRHTGPHAPGVRIPHRKLDGELVFVAGEICAWVRANEVTAVPARPALVVTRKRGRS